MKISDAIYSRIKYFMELNNIQTLWELYKTTGVPKSTLNDLLSTRKNKIIKLTTLIQICYGLNTNLQEFFNDEIFKNIDDDM